MLSARGLTKRFGSFIALDDVSLELRSGEVHCLLGENGAGKSTFCNLVFGAYRPTSGELTLQREPFRPRDPAAAMRAGIAMVHQHFSTIGPLSAVDNLALGRTRWLPERRWIRVRAGEIMERYRFDFPFDASAESLTIGQLQQLEITKCLLAQPKVLIFDEPTAVLAPDAIDGFLDAVRLMADEGRAVLLVTHKLAEVARVADRVSVLRSGRLVDEGEVGSRSIDSFITSMIGRSLDDGSPPVADTGLALVAGDLTAEVLTIDGVSLNEGGRRVLDNVTLIAKAGEVLGIAGVEGNGQSELARIVGGAMRPDEGRVFLGYSETTRLATAQLRRLGLAIIPEDRHRDACVEALSLAENLFIDQLDRFSRRGWLDERALEAAASERIAAFDIRTHGPSQPFRSLSGGNQQKAVLARELALEPLRAVLAVHPTRGLDLGAVRFVYAQLKAAARRGAAVIALSGELDELMAHADRIVVMYRGRIAGEARRGEFDRTTIGRWMAGSAA